MSLKSRRQLERQEREARQRKNIKRWQKFKRIFFPSLFLLTLLLVYVPYYYQQESIEKMYDGIDYSLEEFNLYFGGNEAKSNLTIDYELENLGYYDVKNIQFEFTLKLVYDTSGNEEGSQVVFSDSTKEGHANANEKFEGSLEADYRSFEWSNVGDYLEETKSNGTLYMDIVISFVLEGLESDWIYVRNVKVSSDEEQGTSAQKESGEVEFSNARKNSIKFADVLVLFAFFGTLLSLFSRRNKSEDNFSLDDLEPAPEGIEEYHGEEGYEKKQKGKKSIKNLTSERKELLKSLVQASILTAIFLVWDLIALYNAQNTDISGVDMGDYQERYIRAQIVSIIVLVSAWALSIFPIVFRERFLAYSVWSGLKSLAIRLLYLLSALFWITTLVIVYELESDTTVIRDTSPSYWPFFALLILGVLVSIVDVVLFYCYKSTFTLLRREVARKNLVSSSKKPFKKL